MAESLPLPTLLSQALVAFIIEFDNEFERRMPHRTTNHGSTADSPHVPWLVSMVMWSNCMQYVGDEGVTVGELERLARTTAPPAGMERWGYLVVAPDPADTRSKPPRSAWMVRPTLAGRKAREVWRPLCGVIEQRRRERFGIERIDWLRQSLWALIERIDLELLDCPPILGYGLFSRGRHPGDDRYLRTEGNRASEGRGHAAASDISLPTLLSQVLLAFAIAFERRSELSLAISANLLRVLDDQGARVRDLPLRSGVSKEAISMAIGILQGKHLAVVEPDPTGGRAKVARLTPKGRDAKEAYRQLLGLIEAGMEARFEPEVIGALRASLEQLVGEPTAPLSPLFRGLEPYPEGWRAAVRKPSMLPHYPMVLHRGGFPDGS
jgi:DNA-binding MarR family transcriptional regulator